MTANTGVQRRALPPLHRNWTKATKALEWPAATSTSTKASSSTYKKSHRTGQKEALRASPDAHCPIASPQAPDSQSVLCVEVLQIAHKDHQATQSHRAQDTLREVASTRARCRITISGPNFGFTARVDYAA
ncbi:hypothetical protein V8C42DRAFT_42109 [Trichoderma barbatum]